MAHKSDSESYSKANDKRPAMVLESVNLRPTENGGFIVSCHKRPAKASDDGSPGYYEPPKDYAFATYKAAEQFIRQEVEGA